MTAAAVRAMVTAFVVLAVALVSAPPAHAGRPVTEVFTMTSVWCGATGGFGIGQLAVSHSVTGAGFPGADLSVWAPGSDPATDEPALVGSNTTVERKGDMLTGRIPLRAVSGEPGEGVRPAGDDEPIAVAEYQITVSNAGPATTERQKDHIVQDHQRSNERYRTLRTRTPVVGSGTLTISGHDPVPLDLCTGQHVVEDIRITSPSTVIRTGRYPMSFECVATGASADVYVSLVDAEFVALLVPHGQTPAALGFGYAEVTRSAPTADVEMFDYETGDGRGTATMSVRVKTVQRQTLRNRDRQVSDTLRVEQVQVTGSLVFAGERYQLDSCVGHRARQHVIDHRQRAPQRAARVRR